MPIKRFMANRNARPHKTVFMSLTPLPGPPALVLLLGGSDDDNLFQGPTEELREQLDTLRTAGGN